MQLDQVSAIEQLCSRCKQILINRKALEPAMAALYEESFPPEAISLPKAGEMIARRIVETQEEYQMQRQMCKSNPPKWLLQALSDAQQVLGSGGRLVQGVGHGLLAMCNATDSQIQAGEAALAHIAHAPAIGREAYAQLIEQMVGNVLPWHRDEGVGGKLTLREVSLIAMVVYILTKTGKIPQAQPDLSLDSLCIWANTLVYASDRQSDPKARVSGDMLMALVMSCLYMAVGDDQVLPSCMQSLVTLGDTFALVGRQLTNNAVGCAYGKQAVQVHGALVLPVLQTLAQHLPSVPEQQWTEER